MGDLHVINQSKTNGENVADRIREAQVSVDEGGVENCVILLVGKDGSVMDCWANSSHPFAVVGGLESIKTEFMKACVEKRDK